MTKVLVDRLETQQDSLRFGDPIGCSYHWLEPDKVDWVSQQTPDGRDWLEYMMVGPGSGVPLTKVDARQLGGKAVAERAK